MFNVLNVYGNIDSIMFFKIKEGRQTRGHNFTLVKKQRRLYVSLVSIRFPRGPSKCAIIYKNDCVHASSVKVFKQEHNRQLSRKDGLNFK